MPNKKIISKNAKEANYKPNTTYLNVTHVGPVENIHLEQAPQIFRLATPFVVEKRQPRERAGQVLLDERDAALCNQC